MHGRDSSSGAGRAHVVFPFRAEEVELVERVDESTGAGCACKAGGVVVPAQNDCMSAWPVLQSRTVDV